MIYRHSKQQIDDYFNNQSLNQSSIKALIQEGIEAFLAKREELQKKENIMYYEEASHYLIGSAVDCFLTQGEEEFYRQYAVSKMPRKPPEKPMSIVRALFDKVVIRKEPYYTEEGTGLEPAELKPLEFFKKDLYDIADQHLFYMNRRFPSDKLIKNKDSGKYEPDTRTWKDDNRIPVMLADGLCEQYWTELKGSIGKQLLADDESTLIGILIKSLKTHKNTAFIFQEEEGVDTIYQMPLYFDLEEAPCKILPDIMVVNHVDRSIMLIDGKTTGRYITRFNKEVRKFRYDVQAAFYSKGIDLSRHQISNLIGRDVSSYEIYPFVFAVISITRPELPLLYSLNFEVLLEGEWGDEKQGLEGYKHGLYAFKAWQELGFDVERKYPDGLVVLEKGYNKINI